MTLDTAAATIAAITYKPDWTFTVAPGAAGPRLVIKHPYGTERIPLPLMSVRSMTTRHLVHWVFNWVRDIEARAADAAFRYAGQTVDEIEGP